MRSGRRDRVDGDDRNMTKLEAVMRQFVDRAVNGDPRLMRELLAEIHKNETQAERDASLEPLDDINHEVLEALFVRVRCEAAKRE